MTLGERIAEKRKENGLSQEALGEELGVSRQSVYKWESGSALPEIEKLIAMSRLFGVTIGWLLGVEEAPPTPEPAQPSDSGELTEQQLRMVEEIVGRYIAAWQPAKKRRWPWAVAAAAGAALLLTINSINGELQTLRSEYGSLQNSINFVSSDVNIQISSITSRVEEILKNQNALTASCDVDITSASLAENTVTFSARAVPKTYTDGMEAVFLLDCGSGPVEFPGTLGRAVNSRRSSPVISPTVSPSPLYSSTARSGRPNCWTTSPISIPAPCRSIGPVRITFSCGKGWMKPAS